MRCPMLWSWLRCWRSCCLSHLPGSHQGGLINPLCSPHTKWLTVRDSSCCSMYAPALGYLMFSIGVNLQPEAFSLVFKRPKVSVNRKQEAPLARQDTKACVACFCSCLLQGQYANGL